MTEQPVKPTPGPWHICIDDTGGQFSGWPSIEAPDELDLTIIHRAGFRQEFWEGTTLKVALANAKLIAAAPETAAERDRLVAVLDGLILVCGRTGKSFKDFEEQAAAFQRETGKMRPGKDVPMAATDLGATPEEYRGWVDGKVTEARAVLDEARKP